jgi:biopolymer transport protein ExbB/biopolymer transport protein TolQ
MSVNLAELGVQMGGVARAVVLVLLAMSVYSIAIGAERLLAYRRARRQSLRFAAQATTLLEDERLQEVVVGARAYRRSHVARIVAAALAEYLKKLRLGRLATEEVLESARRAAERASLLVVADLRKGIGGLGTIGATAPFVGLFGTVIGIINAFAAIARTGTGGFQTVAAGIAEALVTTALGLMVALPAVWLHNYLVQKVEGFQVEMNNSSSELLDRLVELAPERP